MFTASDHAVAMAYLAAREASFQAFLAFDIESKDAIDKVVFALCRLLPRLARRSMDLLNSVARE